MVQIFGTPQSATNVRIVRSEKRRAGREADSIFQKLTRLSKVISGIRHYGFIVTAALAVALLPEPSVAE